MSEHELAVKKVADLFDEIHQPPGYLNWDSLRDDEAARELQFARAAYELGRQASTADSGSGWTDDELRAAIHAAAVTEGHSISIEHGASHSATIIQNREVHDLRRLLTALGIDHQPKPELPTEVGSMIRDVVLASNDRCRVMELDRGGYWNGYGYQGETNRRVMPDHITSFGGVLDLDKVRGEQA